MLDFLKDLFSVILTAAACVTVIILILSALGYEDSKDLKKWNNGYCSCGGRWEYQQVVAHWNDTDYIYKCDKCGTIHEFEIAR